MKNRGPYIQSRYNRIENRCGENANNKCPRRTELNRNGKCFEWRCGKRHQWAAWKIKMKNLFNNACTFHHKSYVIFSAFLFPETALHYFRFVFQSDAAHSFVFGSVVDRWCECSRTFATGWSVLHTSTKLCVSVYRHLLPPFTIQHLFIWREHTWTSRTHTHTYRRRRRRRWTEHWLSFWFGWLHS